MNEKITIFSCRFYPLPSEYCERTIQIYIRLKKFNFCDVSSAPYIIKFLGIYYGETLYNPHVIDSLKIARYCDRITKFYNDMFYQCVMKRLSFENIGIDEKGDC